MLELKRASAVGRYESRSHGSNTRKSFVSHDSSCMFMFEEAKVKAGSQEMDDEMRKKSFFQSNQMI